MTPTDTCEICSGSGRTNLCPACGGTGIIGVTDCYERKCDACASTGRVKEHDCLACGGARPGATPEDPR